ncbi:MAG: SIS domain-containing protein [Thermoplasmata archaeon]|nr:SIS domain-containing protein [Thermoplasmata archaeon]
MVTARDKLHEFLDDLKSTIDTNIDLGGAEIKDVFMGGMGGSAIAANFVASCCAQYMDIPISVNRSPIVPHWVGRNTLAIISSYSGNTEETLEMYAKAKSVGACIVVITAGGKMEGMAKDDGYPILKVPTGFEPRYSAGYMIGYIAALLSKIGYPQFKDRLMDCMPSLENYRNYLEAPGSLAHLLAQKYSDCVPVLCTENKFKPVSLRWRAAFNENAKTICFETSLSEFNSFETTPWASYKGKRMRLIVLTGEDDLVDGGLVKTAVQNIESLGFPFDLVAVGGTSHEERMFRALILGDYVTVYIAEAAGIDPEITTVISELKRRIRAKKF